MNKQIELIECVEKHHVIWNTKVVKQQNAEKIKSAWRAVAEILHLEESICRKKWAKLRNGFKCFIKNTNGDVSQRRRGCKNAHLYKSMEFLLFRKDTISTVDQICNSKQQQNRSMPKGGIIKEIHTSTNIKLTKENVESKPIIGKKLTDSGKETLLNCSNVAQHLVNPQRIIPISHRFVISKKTPGTNTDKTIPLKVITLPANVWPKIFVNKTGTQNGVVSPRRTLIELANLNKLKQMGQSAIEDQQVEKVADKQLKNTLKNETSSDSLVTSAINKDTDQDVAGASLEILSKAARDEASLPLSPWPWSTASLIWQSPLDAIITKLQTIQHNKDEYLRYAINAAYGLPYKKITIGRENGDEAKQRTECQKYIQGEVESYFR